MQPTPSAIAAVSSSPSLSGTWPNLTRHGETWWPSLSCHELQFQWFHNATAIRSNHQSTQRRWCLEDSPPTPWSISWRCFCTACCTRRCPSWPHPLVLWSPKSYRSRTPAKNPSRRESREREVSRARQRSHGSYHRQAVAVPAKSPVHVKATLMGKAGDDVLDGASEDVPVVRQTRGEWRTVIEGVPESETGIRSQCCVTSVLKTCIWQTVLQTDRSLKNFQQPNAIAETFAARWPWLLMQLFWPTKRAVVPSQITQLLTSGSWYWLRKGWCKFGLMQVQVTVAPTLCRGYIWENS